MLKLLHQRSGVLSGIFLLLVYLCYRIYESNVDATTLRKQTLEDTVPTVAVTYPTPVPPTETISLPGNIQAWFEAPIYAQVSGYVKMWYKDYGDQVKTGDILAEINAPDLDAEYAQVRADLESERARYRLAEVTAKRWVALRPNHAVSEQSITVQEQNLKVQAALVKAAEQKVRNMEAFHIPDRRPHWRLCVGDDLVPAGDLRDAAPPVASRRFNQTLLDVFQKDLATAGDEI